MVKPKIDEFAALKEPFSYAQPPKGGSLIFAALMIVFAGGAILHKRIVCRQF